MICETSPLVLGSGSPRRREILQTLAIPCRVLPCHVDETCRPDEDPLSYLSRIAILKLRDVASVLDGQCFGGVLVADTIVLVDNQILGKPLDDAHAVRMLTSLSGRSHQVLTRFAVASPKDPSCAVHEETVCTVVEFRRLTDDEVLRYVATGEGRDKAGGYAVQGIGGFAVSQIMGSYSNVVGLPACEVVVALRRTGLLETYPV